MIKTKIRIFVILAGVMLTAACHPYYNTFYNAEEAYSIAHRKHRKVMRDFPDSLVVTPSSEIEAGYDRAIAKSLKMMDIYPKDRKYKDKAHFLMGKASFYKKDFPVTVSRMRDLQDEYPQSPLVPESYIYTAKAHIMMDNLAIAEEILLKLLEEHPTLDQNQEITMLLVEIAMRREGRSHALGLLEGIRLSSLPLEKRIDIILRMADLQYELKQYGKALGLLHGAPRTKNLPYLMYRTDRSIYHCYEAMDSLDVALAHLWGMHKNRLFKEHRYEILYYRAVTLRRLGRADEALALLDEVARMCERAGKDDEDGLCGRAHYELAYIYLLKGDLDLAVSAFELASRSEKSGMSDKARARMMALKKLRELREPDSSGNIPVAARYGIAEIFQFELEAPDSAYTYYMQLSGADADSSVRPRAVLMAAMLSRDALRDTAKADSLFRVVLKDYEGTAYARRAQIELDVEVTVVLRRELAEREFRAAEALTEADMVEAVKAFYNVYKLYHELDIAPKSLHAAAWYTDNSLQKKRAAMTLYEELCEKYPDSKECKTSAEPRLAIARDSIEVRKKRREERAKAAAADSATVKEPLPADSGAAAPQSPQPANKPEDEEDL
jgi:TolA-binding protein